MLSHVIGRVPVGYFSGFALSSRLFIQSQEIIEWIGALVLLIITVLSLIKQVYYFKKGEVKKVNLDELKEVLKEIEKNKK